CGPAGPCGPGGPGGPGSPTHAHGSGSGAGSGCGSAQLRVTMRVSRSAGVLPPLRAGVITVRVRSSVRVCTPPDPTSAGTQTDQSPIAVHGPQPDTTASTGVGAGPVPAPRTRNT